MFLNFNLLCLLYLNILHYGFTMHHFIFKLDLFILFLDQSLQVFIILNFEYFIGFKHFLGSFKVINLNHSALHSKVGQLPLLKEFKVERNLRGQLPLAVQQLAAKQSAPNWIQQDHPDVLNSFKYV